MINSVLAMALGKHGTRYRYKQGCRCKRCRKANSKYSYKRQKKLLAMGRCRRCGKKRDSDSPINCEACLEKRRVA